MTIKQLRKALLGKYIHFTAEYRSEDTAWGGIVKKVESIERGKGARLHLIPYFDDKPLTERNGIMPIPQDELEELVSKGYLSDRELNVEPKSALLFNGITDTIYTQLLDGIPKDGDKRLVVIRYALGFGAMFSKMFYTIGKNQYKYAGNCTKCSFDWHRCRRYCKKYGCSYLEKYELNTKRL